MMFITKKIRGSPAAILSASLFVLLFTSGCAQVVSIRPLYTNADLEKPVADPRIVGEWIIPGDQSDRDPAAPPAARWKITPTFDWYEVEVRYPKEDSKPGETACSYSMRLVAMEEKLFFDLNLDHCGEGEAIKPDSTVGLVPAHVIGRLWVEKDLLRVSMLNKDFLEQHTPAGFAETVRVDQGSYISIITASTEELREYLRKNSDNEEAQGTGMYLCRPGSDCAARTVEEDLERMPSNSEVLKEAAEFYLARGLYERAVEMQRRSLKLNPGDASEHTSIGESLLFRRDFEGARREFTAAGPSKPDAGALVPWSYFLEGAYAKTVAAAAQYRLTKEPRSADPILLKYYSLMRLGRRREAESFLNEQSMNEGPLEEHQLLLEAQGRLTGLPYVEGKDEKERRTLFFRCLAHTSRGQVEWARNDLKTLVADKPNDSFYVLAAKIELERLPPPKEH